MTRENQFGDSKEMQNRRTSTGSGREPEKFCEVVTTPRPRATKEWKVRVVTIAVITVAAVFAVARNTGFQWPMGRAVSYSSESSSSKASQNGSQPQDVLYRMFDAASEGDVEAYLDCYTGSMRRRLEQSRDEMKRDAFAQHLTRTNEQIKGIAISTPPPVSDTEVQVTVEFIYQDRNEVQHFLLQRTTGEWKIAQVDAVERVETLVPYGTPAY